jgi:hypothetical protein
MEKGAGIGLEKKIPLFQAGVPDGDEDQAINKIAERIFGEREAVVSLKKIISSFFSMRWQGRSLSCVCLSH